MTTHEIYWVIAGAGKMHVGGGSAPVRAGQAIWVPPGHRQWIENTAETDLFFLAVCQPPWSRADEVIEKGGTRKGGIQPSRIWTSTCGKGISIPAALSSL